ITHRSDGREAPSRPRQSSTGAAKVGGLAAPVDVLRAIPRLHGARHGEMTESPKSTQVAIVGAGPAGLVLSHLLRRAGIESVVLENRTRAYVEQRVRAGVLEQGTVELLDRLGLSERLHREGLVHHGVLLTFGGRRHRIALSDLTGGRSITVYGQH